jgi:transposase
MICKKKPDYNQIHLLPPNIEDWINEDNPVRFISEFVDKLDLCKIGIKESKPILGRAPYDERLLLKIWLYGYFEDIRSTRKLEKSCYQQLPLLWLTGMNYPDHSTLGNFSKKNREAMKKLFKEVVKIAVEGNLVGLVLQAIDGTKIRADVSKKKTISKEDLELVLKVLNEKVNEYFKETDKNSEEEKWEYRIPSELKKKEDRQEWIEKKIAEMDEVKKYNIKEDIKKQLKEFEKEDTKFLNKSDIDSRMMKNEGKKVFSYNAQAVVDNKCGIITAGDVVNEESDNKELVKDIEESIENTGKASKENLLDGGYFSGEQLSEAEIKGYNVLVNIPKDCCIKSHDRDNQFHQCNFIYDEEKHCYKCPEGRNLEFERKKKHKNKDYEVDIYRCKDYKTCPLSKDCSKDKRGRTIEISPYKESVDRQIEKLKIPENKELLKKRKEIVEPLFGYIKHIMGFRRWTLRGIDNIKAQWALICTTVNLKKMFNYWKTGELKLV